MTKGKSTLIVTGAGGWLGSSIIELTGEKNFKDNFNKVILLTFKSEEVDPKYSADELSKVNSIKYTWLFGDLLLDKIYYDLQKILQQDEDLKVIYSASVIHAKSSKDFFKINNRALEKFVKKISKYGPSKFLYISSNSPFGFNNGESPFNEQSKYNPIGNYGKSKKFAEMFLLSHLKNTDLKIIRAPWFHGNNMPMRQKLFLKKAALGTFPIIFPGTNKRSIINTKDLAKASINLITRPSIKTIYWVCEEKPITMKEFIKIIQKSATKNKFVKRSKPKFKFLFMPPLTSLIFCILDIILQKIGIYSKIIHVMGELGMNIKADSRIYREEFPDHIFITIEKSIDLEIKEAFNI